MLKIFSLSKNVSKKGEIAIVGYLRLKDLRRVS